MWRSRWRCVIKPAYSFSFLLSINIFVWQNVLYFLDAPRTRFLLCLIKYASKNVCNSAEVKCEHPVPRVGVVQNTCHYTRVRRQTIQLIMSCNAFIISSLPFPSLAKLSNLTSEPYFRFREVQNLKIDHSNTGYLQVKYLSSVLSSVLPCGGHQQKILLQVHRP